MNWRRGALLCAAQVDVEDLFMTFLQRFTKQGRSVTDRKGPSYAPAKFAEQPEAKADKVSNKAFAAAMERLLSMNQIRVITEGATIEAADQDH
jgi:hypothetical protein